MFKVGNFINKEDLDIQDITFSLNHNGHKVQKGNSKDLIFSFDRIISHISKFITLKIGDLIYTGTPKGVGTIKNGDILEGFIEKKEMLKVLI